MKVIKRIFLVLILFLILLFIYQMFQYTVSSFGVEDLKGTQINNTEAENLGGKFITIFSVLGSIISVVVLIAIGLKYMMGSVEEKAEYKKSFMPYIIGATFVFAASSIAGIIYSSVTK